MACSVHRASIRLVSVGHVGPLAYFSGTGGNLIPTQAFTSECAGHVEVLYGTVSGMVGVLAQLSQEQYTFLSKARCQTPHSHAEFLSRIASHAQLLFTSCPHTKAPHGAPPWGAICVALAMSVE